MNTLQTISQIFTILAMFSVTVSTIYMLYKNWKTDKAFKLMMENQNQDHKNYITKLHAEMHPGKERFTVIDNDKKDKRDE